MGIGSKRVERERCDLVLCFLISWISWIRLGQINGQIRGTTGWSGVSEGMRPVSCWLSDKGVVAQTRNREPMDK
jgi:hypothetical protein